MDIERRKLLTWLGIGGGVGAGIFVGASLLGSGGWTSSERTHTQPPRTSDVRHAEKFETVIDAVAAGADPNGDEPINAVLETHADDDTLLSFPDGTYRLRPVDLSGYTNLGISAAGETAPTFRATDHCLGGGDAFVRFHDVEALLLDSVEFDFGADGVGGVIRINATGDVTVSDVTASGGCSEQVACFRIDVLEEAATGRVERLSIDNRNEDTALTGIYVGKDHAGEVVFRDCDVQGFTDNGLYASPPGLDGAQGGTVHVEGGTYRNNNISNVRLGSEGSLARGIESISDGQTPTIGDSVSANARGFRLRSGRDQLIEDCTVRITQNSPYTHGGIVFHQTNGGAVVRGTDIEIDRDETPAIRTFPVDSDHSGTLLFEGVEVTGNAVGTETILLEGRDGTVFRDCLIEQSGEDRSGIHFKDSTDCRIVDSRIDVTQNALVLRGSNVTIENSTLVTPAGSEEIDELEASDGDFTPREEQ